MLISEIELADLYLNRRSVLVLKIITLAELQAILVYQIEGYVMFTNDNIVIYK